MINVEALKNKVLDLAMHGKLVAQDPQDEPASALVEKIKAEKAQLIKDKKIKKTKALPPIEEDEIPYEIPDSWEWVKLDDILDVRDGTHDTPKYLDKGIPLITGKNIKNGEINFDDVNFISEIDADKINERSKVDENDILMPMIGTIGNPVINTVVKKFAIKNVALFKYIKGNNMKYIYYYLIFSEKTMNKISKGSTQKFISLKKIRNFITPLPPQQEQQRIVDKIEEIFAELDKLDEASQKYDECKELINKRVLDLAMHGKLVAQDPQDEPASALVEKIKEEKAQLIKSKKIKKTKALPPIEEDEIPYEIPDSWEWVRLGEVTEFQLGKTPAKKDDKYWNSADIPWVSISDLNNGIVHETERSISKIASKEVFSENIVPKDSLLMSFKLTIGKMGILNAPAYHNEAIISFKLINDTDNIFRNYLFFSLPFFTNFAKTTPAVKGKTLNKKILTNMLVALPPQQEQQRIVDKIEEIFDVLNND